MIPPATTPPATPPADALLKPLSRLLRPLVRLMIRSGITFPLIADLLRSLYVDVAVRDLLADPKAQTDSRISILTGIHRKEIRRFREAGSPVDEVPAVVTLSSQIVARWLGTPAFTDRDGAPLVLPRTSRDESAPSFDSLARSVTSDVRARAVLDDLAAQSVVILEPDDRVRLNMAAFIPKQGREEQLFYFARNLHDHLAAAAANIATEPAPFLDRSVHYDRLSPAVAQALEQAGRDAAQKLLIDINRLALTLIDAETAAGSPADLSRRVNLGVYLYVDREVDEATGS